MKKLIIFGTGDFAQLANFYFGLDSRKKPVAFALDGAYIKEDTFEGLPVIPFERIKEKFPPSEYMMFIAIGYSKMNKNREEKYFTAKEKGYELATYISSKCSYMSQHAPGDNTFIFEDNTIQPFVKIGNNNILWSGNHIGHHTIIHHHNFISSHVVISGRCEINSNCFLGVNSTLHNNVTLQKNTLVAAGAIIGKDTIANGVYLPPKTNLFTKKSDELNF